MNKYKGFTREQLIDILADFAVFTATVDNNYGRGEKNTNKEAYVSLYKTYPVRSRKYPAFSLAVMFDAMISEIQRAREIASFSLPDGDL